MPTYRRTWARLIYEVRRCPECRGEGKVDGKACFFCKGAGSLTRVVNCPRCPTSAPDPHCLSCRGTGIAGYIGSHPPVIQEEE